MAYAVYIATVCGAVGLMLSMPSVRSKPAKVGGMLALASLGGFLIFLMQHFDDGGQSVFYYVFTFIAIAAAGRVITHPRPVYSALFFVMVVMSSSGLFLLLEAEFMAFAMIIIYAGAILVTYMFVIMLAMLPQSAHEPDTSPVYDRTAREPFSAVILGFALLAVLVSVLFRAEGKIQTNYAADVMTHAKVMPGRYESKRITPLLVAEGLIPQGDRVESVDFEKEILTVTGDNDKTYDIAMRQLVSGRSEPKPGDMGAPGSHVQGQTVKEYLLGQVYNIDQVGMNLFESHTLGIELAAVVLLLSMVGAIVIARKPIDEN